MSQAEDLLNSLEYSNEESTTHEHIHTVSDSDPDFIVDPTTRTIANNTGHEIVLMQLDHGSECFTFELPRYIENHDMTLCNTVKIHYINTGANNVKHEDIYDVKDLRVDPDDENKVIWSWTVKRQATQHAGKLAFLVCFQCTVEDNIVTYEWHTDIFADVTVKKSLHHEEQMVIEYADVLEEWRIRLFGSVDEGIQSISEATSDAITQIQNKVTASTNDQIARVTVAAQEAVDAKDYVQAIVAENEAYTKRESDHRYASSIVNDDSGEHIVLEDSSDFVLQHLVGYGKSKQYTTNGYQLIDPTGDALQTFSRGGATVTNNGDGTFTISGSGALTEDVSSYYFYTHTKTVELLKAGMLYFKDVATTVPKVYIHPRMNGTNLATLSVNSADGFEITQEMLDDSTFQIAIGFYAATGTTIVGGALKPMLYQDGDGTFERFTNGRPAPNQNYPQDIIGIGTVRNLFNAYAEQTNTYGTATISDNGATISVTGTWYTTIACSLEGNKEYTISFSIESYTVNSRGVRLLYADGSFSEYVYTSTVKIVPPQEVIGVYFYSGNDTSGTAVFKNFMIYDASISLSEFHPYKNRHYEVDYDIYTGNLINANAFNQLSTTNFEVSEDTYTIKVVGGTSNGWTSASYFLPNGLVKAIRGKTLYLACDSFTSAQDVNVRIGLNITLEDGSMDYPESLGVTKHIRAVAIPDTAKKILFAIYSNNTGTSLTTDNTVIVRGLRMGFKEHFKWMPYNHKRLTASKSTPWYGIPVNSGGNYTDQNGVQYIADYRDFERGVDVNHCRKLVFDGTETWQYGDYQGIKYLIHPLSKAGVTGGNLHDFCTHAVHASADAVVAFKGDDFVVATNIFFSNVQNGVEYTNAEDWKNTLADLYANGSPVTVVYQLKNPIETKIPEAEYQAYLSAHTNKLITTIVNDSGMHMETSYIADTKTFFNNSRGASDEQVQTSVDAWLTNYFTSAEGVSF